MAEEAKKEAPAAAEAVVATTGKKARPTNCAQSNKRIRRKDWYYRDGKYFANKQCYHLLVATDKAKKEKEKEKEAATPTAG